MTEDDHKDQKTSISREFTLHTVLVVYSCVRFKVLFLKKIIIKNSLHIFGMS